MEQPSEAGGFIMVPNDFFDAIIRCRMAGASRQVFDAILRKTWGYQKRADWIALSQFCLMTGLSKAHVCRGLKQLIQMEFIVAKKGNENRPVYSIQADYSRWKPLPKMAILPKKEIPVAKNGNPGYPFWDTTINNNTTNNSTKEKKEAAIVFEYESSRFVNITEQHMERWSEAYPAVDVATELRQMQEWVDTNRKNRKSNWQRFIINWLKRSQDRARPIMSRGKGLNNGNGKSISGVKPPLACEASGSSKYEKYIYEIRDTNP